MQLVTASYYLYIMKNSYNKIMLELKQLSSEKDLQQMRRFGIITDSALGVSITKLRKIEKRIKSDHDLAKRLWFAPSHEARLLGSMISDPQKITLKEIDKIVKAFNTWDLVDEYCLNLFGKSRHGYHICFRYKDARDEFVKRSTFAMMAVYAWSNDDIPDAKFERFFPVIIEASTDERNFVKKAVNWALRQIGKRNLRLNKKAISAAKEIQKIDSKSSKWIARDALKELTSPKVQARLRSK